VLTNETELNCYRILTIGNDMASLFLYLFAGKPKHIECAIFVGLYLLQETLLG